MKLTILEGDHIFRRFVFIFILNKIKNIYLFKRPSNDHPYIKIEEIPSNKIVDSFPGFIYLFI
jgi:hypothetical protein